MTRRALLGGVVMASLVVCGEWCASVALQGPLLRLQQYYARGARLMAVIECREAERCSVLRGESVCAWACEACGGHDAPLQLTPRVECACRQPVCAMQRLAQAREGGSETRRGTSAPPAHEHGVACGMRSA